jgi:hypothetical protein
VTTFNQREYRHAIVQEMLVLAKHNGVASTDDVQNIPTEYRAELFDLAQVSVCKRNGIELAEADDPRHDVLRREPNGFPR